MTDSKRIRAAMNQTFDHILNWRLLKGAHHFPGPDGGTCINEAAIVAAGLPYREVTDASDCPPCFCRVLADYAIGLNDRMPDDERQALISFVLRLSGSADTPEIERVRFNFILIESIQQLLAPVAAFHGLKDIALQCRISAAPNDIVKIAQAMIDVMAPTTGVASHVLDCALSIESAERRSNLKSFYNAMLSLAAAAEHASRVIPAWPIAISILDDALKIGRQAPPLDLAVVRARMDVARLAEAMS